MFAAAHSTHALALPRADVCATFHHLFSIRSVHPCISSRLYNSGYLLHLSSLRPLRLCISLQIADVCSAYLYYRHSTCVLACHMPSYRLHPLCIYLTCTVTPVYGDCGCVDNCVTDKIIEIYLISQTACTSIPPADGGTVFCKGIGVYHVVRDRSQAQWMARPGRRALQLGYLPMDTPGDPGSNKCCADYLPPKGPIRIHRRSQHRQCVDPPTPSIPPDCPDPALHFDRL